MDAPSLKGRPGSGAWMGLVAGVLLLLLIDYALGPRPSRLAPVWWVTALGVALFALCSNRWRRRLLLAAATLFLACLAMEMCFRLFLVRPHVPRTETAFAEQIAAAWPEPVPAERRAGTFRILALADSFGLYGGTNNFHDLLERRLEEDGRPVELINFSQGGMEPPNQLELLRRFGRRYQPDLVLHSFYVGNDFTRADWPLHFFRWPFRAPGGLRTLRPANWWSRTWGHLCLQVMADQWRSRKEPRDRVSPGRFSEASYLELCRKKTALLRRELDPDEAWTHVGETLGAIRSEAAAMGAAYAMVIHPDELQVDPALLRAVCTRSRPDPSTLAREQPQQYLVRLCREAGVPCLDLLPAFREAGAKERLYRPRDTHYNERGNRLAADRIEAFLRAETGNPRQKGVVSP